MAMNVRKNVSIALVLGALGAWSPSRASADQSNKLTYLTFSNAVAIPGHVLPAGTYTFRLADSSSDRNIVQIFNEAGTQLIATLLTIPDRRLDPTDDTVIKLGEPSGNAPPAITKWFYPGDSSGQEFIYPNSPR
jgi:hypothetical protein